MKFVFFLCLFMTSMCSFAQKNYLVLHYTMSNSGRWYIGGDIPDGMNEYYRAPSSDGGVQRTIVAASIINQLAERGYEVEFNPDENTYLLSKKSSGTSSAVQRVRADDDFEIYEVARYNLQGLPINANEKGIQIIVYSNYTTKTVIVE